MSFETMEMTPFPENQMATKVRNILLNQCRIILTLSNLSVSKLVSSLAEPLCV
jgi:hypothetical protein